MHKGFKQLINLILLVTIGLAFTLFIRQQFFAPALKLSIGMPSAGIDRHTLAVVVKRGDTFSERVAQLYLEKRNINPENLFYIDLPDDDSVSAAEFSSAYGKLQQSLPNHIQAMVATWQRPYKVDCMSITSAMTFGFDRQWCQPQLSGKATKCSTTAKSPYFNSQSRYPWTDLGIRPTMLLTGDSLQDVNALINRGINADLSNPIGANAFLIKTKDTKRSVRWPQFAYAAKQPSTDKLRILAKDLSAARQDYIEDETLLVYQTGGAYIPEIDENDYLPGAVADHLTSFGGQGYSKKGQMKALRWIEAGATGSYGTVVEPCNYIAKFPDANVLIKHYALGETLLESYWKSVNMPGEGLFIGEPLARPFGLFQLQLQGGRIQIRTNLLDIYQSYQLEYFDLEKATYVQVKQGSAAVNKKRREVFIQFPAHQTFRYRVIQRGIEEPS